MIPHKLKKYASIAVHLDIIYMDHNQKS